MPCSVLAKLSSRRKRPARNHPGDPVVPRADTLPSTETREEEARQEVGRQARGRRGGHYVGRR